MLHRLVAAPLIAAVAALAFLSPIAPVHAASTAAVTVTFDTIDAIGPNNSYLVVTGIVAGQSAPTTAKWQMEDPVMQVCIRLGTLAMSKPGKYRFSIDNNFYPTTNCTLTLRTP